MAKEAVRFERRDDVIRPGEMLAEKVGQSFVVRGMLKKLPAGHAIWLLVEDQATGGVWPQSFSPVLHDPELKGWMGKIDGTCSGYTKIWAVVAPPDCPGYVPILPAGRATAEDL
jgi:hypothetical protein